MSFVQSAYNQWAESYDRDDNKTRDLDQEMTRRALQDLSFDTILEIGCGTGKNSLFLAGIGRSLIGLDFSAEMIAKAREKISNPQVRFEQADLLKPWPIKDGAVDFVVCNLVLEHIEDLEPIFAEAARVLQVGGRFYISEFHPFRQYQGKQARFTQDGVVKLVPAYLHNTSDFLRAADAHDFQLIRLDEGWHNEDVDGGKPPRILTLLFGKQPKVSDEQRTKNEK